MKDLNKLTKKELIEKVIKSDTCFQRLFRLTKSILNEWEFAVNMSLLYWILGILGGMALGIVIGAGI